MQLAHLRRAFGVGSAVALITLTAACGGSGSGSASDTRSTSSGSQPKAAQPAVLTTSDIGSTLAAAQKRAGTYTFRLTTSGATSTSGSGEASVKDDKPSVRSTTQVQGSTVEVILKDGLIYLKSPIFRAEKPWLEINPHDKTGLGAIFGQLGSSSDPGKNLAAMSDASKVTRAGSEQVGGVETTHYSVVLPRRAIVHALGYPKQIASLLPAELNYDIWVDGKDLVRKVESTVAVQGRTSVTDITFSDYGKPVSIAAPPADQTTTKSPLG